MGSENNLGTDIPASSRKKTSLDMLSIDRDSGGTIIAVCTLVSGVP